MLLTPDNPGFHLVNNTYTHLDHLADAEYTIGDVGKVLGRLQRFNNHAPYGHYSVAEHCWHASFLYAYNRKGALMHDAAEWITGDIPTPIKKRLDGIKEIEALVDRDLETRFGFDPVDKFTFKVIDNVLFQLEHYWLYDTKEGPIFDIPGFEIYQWAPEKATEKWLERWEELQAAP